MRAPRLHRAFAFARARSLLGSSLAFVAATLAHAAAPTTFVLVDPAHAWRATPVAKATASNLIIDEVLQPATGRSRIVVVSSRVVDDTPDSLENFAQTIKRTFAPGAGPDTLNVETTRLGFAGHELHFPLGRDTATFDCELFVFADNAARRGILCAAAQNDPAVSYSLLARLQRQAPATDGVVRLPALKIRDDAVSDFSISFRILGNHASRRVVRLVVTDVPATHGTPSGIEVGDEIVSINGRASQEFDSAIGRDTELGRIFLNRHIGDSVTLNLVSARSHEPYTVTLRIDDFRLWFKP